MQNRITLVLTTPISPKSPMNEHLRLHGDGDKDVVFWVTDAKKTWENTTQNGAKSIR
jgi:4-hydroxyphenylpyruvate dioxygenase